MQIGDKVRFVSEVGGGIVTRFQGKNTVFVEDEDGFEVPMLVSQVVVIDEEKERRSMPKDEKQEASSERREMEPCDRPITFRPKVVERAEGNVLDVQMCFVPNERKADTWNLYLVNDSNYKVTLQILRPQGEAYYMCASMQLSPNTKQKLQEMALDEVGQWEHIVVQMLAVKEDKPFTLQMPVSKRVHIPPQKFHKAGAFQPTPFFPQPALSFSLVKD
ncbi:MAG: DUF2027 domain-containing protein [Bacteroidaceae bacterium]|nr:DUF2027 domain-containing protein [Bacteroidaceae bacterium]